MSASAEIRRRRDRSGDSAVYHRDRWQCRMPQCLCPAGRAIDPALRGDPGPWSPSIDHVVLLADGGPDTPDNKRAAHKRCSQADGEGSGSVRLPEPGPHLSSRIGDLFPALADLAGT
jgi:hypothetical protein